MKKTIEGERVRDLRKKMKFTQPQLARKVGVTYQIISKIEMGRIKSPSGNTVYNLAEALKTTVEYLMGGIGFSESGKREINTNQIPVLDLSEVIEWCKTDVKSLAESDRQYIISPIEDKHAFAIRIKTDSMEGKGAKQLPFGCTAICVPTAQIVPNKFIVFHNEESQSSFIREAVIEDTVSLKPLNSRYQIREMTEKFFPLAIVISFYSEC